MKIFSLAVREMVLKLILLYQKTLSLDHGPLNRFFPYGYCRFHPTCSVYGYQAVAKHGVIKGGLMAISRIFRCHPWSKGGHDPVK